GEGGGNCFADEELEFPDKRSLKRGDAALAIPLTGMTVADLKERPARVNRDEERRPGYQFFIIKVARVYAGRRAADAARRFGRRHAHAAEKWAQRDFDTVAEARHHPLLVQRDYLHLRVWVIFRQKASSRSEGGVGVRDGELDGLNPPFEHVARFRAFDINRPGQNMSAGTFIGDLFNNIA